VSNETAINSTNEIMDTAEVQMGVAENFLGRDFDEEFFNSLVMLSDLDGLPGAEDLSHDGLFGDPMIDAFLEDIAQEACMKILESVRSANLSITHKFC